MADWVPPGDRCASCRAAGGLCVPGMLTQKRSGSKRKGLGKMGFLPWKENGDVSEIQKTCWEWVGMWLIIVYQSQALFGGDLDGQRGAGGKFWKFICL